MSNKLYAAEFRSMRSAIHNIAIFTAENWATEFFQVLNESEEMPDITEFNYNSDKYVDTIEINFRQPPTHYNETELVYINNPINSIPDVYGY